MTDKLYWNTISGSPFYEVAQPWMKDYVYPPRRTSAHSELIVPGPHGSYQLAETISELRRILRLHLTTSD
jgi:hypothetical protein